MELPKPWKHLRSDEHLREFLQLSPSLAQVYEGEVSSIAESPGMSSTTAEPPSAATESVNNAYQNLYLHTKADAADASRDTADLVAPGPAAAVPGTTTPAVTAAMRPPVAGEIVLTFSDQGEGGTSARVSVPVDEIMRQAEPLDTRPGGGGQRPGPARPHCPPARSSTDIGTLLWSSTIGQDAALETTLMRAFEDTERLRLAVTSTHDPLAALPWECLFIPRHRIFAGQAHATVCGPRNP